MSFLQGVNDCLCGAFEKVAKAHGVDKVIDDNVSKKNDELPFKYYYNGRKFITAHTLIYVDNCFKLSIVKHLPEGAVPETFYLTFKGELCNENGTPKT